MLLYFACFHLAIRKKNNWKTETEGERSRKLSQWFNVKGQKQQNKDQIQKQLKGNAKKRDDVP